MTNNIKTINRTLRTLLPFVLALTTGCNDAKDSSISSSANSSSSTSMSNSSSASSSLHAGVFTEYNDISWEKSIKGTYETRWYRYEGFSAPFHSLIKLTENPEELSSSLNEWLSHAQLYGFNRNEWQWMQRNLNEISWAILDELTDAIIVQNERYQTHDVYAEDIEVNVELVSEDIITGAVVYSIKAEQELAPKECPASGIHECPTYLQIDADLHLYGLISGGFHSGRRLIILDDLKLNIRRFTIENGHISLELLNNESVLNFSDRLVAVTQWDELGLNSSVNNSQGSSVIPNDSFFAPLRYPTAVSIADQAVRSSKINLIGTFQTRNLKIQARVLGSFQSWTVLDLPNPDFNTSEFLSGPIEDSELTLKLQIIPSY